MVAAVVSEKLTIVKESVVKSIEKSTVVKERDITSKVGKRNVSPVVSQKSAVDDKDNPKASKVLDESNKAEVVTPIIKKVPVAMESDKETKPVVVTDVKAPVFMAVEIVVKKDNPKVTSKVLDESVKVPVVKESVKVPVVKKSVKASSVVADKPSSVLADKVDVVVKKSVKASSVVADKLSSVVADKVDMVVKKSVKASSVVADKPSSVVTDKVDVVKDNINVVTDKVVKENVLSVVVDKASNINVVTVVDKASDVLKNKSARKGKKPVVGCQSKEENREFKAKVNVKRKMILSKEDDRKKKLKGKSKKDVSDFELENDVVDYSSDKADRKRKKLKIKAGLKRKRSGSDSSNSSKLDTKKDDRKKKLKGKSKKDVSDSELKTDVVDYSFDEAYQKRKKLKIKVGLKRKMSGLDSLNSSELDTKSIKILIRKLEKTVKKQESDEESVPKKVTPSKIHDILGVPFEGYSLFDLNEREVDHEFIRKWAGQFYPLELKKVRVNDIAQKLIAAQEINFLFKVNFLTLFTNTMGKVDGLKGQICLDVVRRLHEDFVIFDIDWCWYIYDCLQDSKLPGGTNHYLGPLTFLIRCKNLKVLLVFRKLLRKRVMLEDYIRKASLKCPGDEKFIVLHEKYVNLFKDSISFEDDGNGDNVGGDDENGDDDGGNVDNDANDGGDDENRDDDDGKWKTKENFHDCRIFTMLHMETFDGGPASNLDCGLPVESQLQRDMLRRLRFKFTTKILLHEINVHAGKMIKLAKEFGKTDPVKKMAIIVDAFKIREEHDCIYLVLQFG
nr:hypothetical protein [Tanacetum cinerariifolium]GEX07974.1 hypothetical protein [Tanacetum cinerariifolium]